MKNKYLRLFVAQTKLMTAEKMQLNRFCQYGEYLAYKISLPPNSSNVENEIDFIFSVDIEDAQYYFSNEIEEEDFVNFEEHLSSYLNILFQRKLEFDDKNEKYEKVMTKLREVMTEEEQQCLAVHIDVSASNVIQSLISADLDDKT